VSFGWAERSPMIDSLSSISLFALLALVAGAYGVRALVRGRARYDLFYVRHWCLGLDIRLALQTVGVMIHPPSKAY